MKNHNKITCIRVYKVDLKMKEGHYSWSNQTYRSFDSTIVEIETSEGINGYGEVCPLGPTYLPAYAEGARIGVKKIAKTLIGKDPTNINEINLLMDNALRGHPYVKSAIDIACWDIFGKSVNKPLFTLLGGKLQNKIKLFKVISRDIPEIMQEKVIEYQEQGFRQFQMKVGAEPSVDIRRITSVAKNLKPGNVLGADANCGWNQHDAIRVVKAISNLDVYIEQPCFTYEECRVIRQKTNLPFILDECMDSVQSVLRAWKDQAVDIINLKIGRFGGISKAKLIRDLCVSLGISLTIEDTWGSQIADAAIAHLAHSTPKEFHFQSSAFHEYTEVVTAQGQPTIETGYMSCSDAPGLGIIPNFESLGDPLFTYT